MTTVDEFKKRLKEKGWRFVGGLSGRNTSTGQEADIYQLGDGGDEVNGYHLLRIEAFGPEDFIIRYSRTSGKKVRVRRTYLPRTGFIVFRPGDPRKELMKSDLSLYAEFRNGEFLGNETELLQSTNLAGLLSKPQNS